VPDVCRSEIAAAFLLIASTAFGAVEGPGRTQLIRAVRVSAPPSIDGKLDDPQWLTAPVFDEFVQSFPDEGARPSEPTEVRVLYDDDNLYVGIICYDSRPEQILRQDSALRFRWLLPRFKSQSSRSIRFHRQRRWRTQRQLLFPGQPEQR